MARVETGEIAGTEAASHVFSESGADIRAKIFQSAVEGGFTLVGVEEQTQDLNQVFRNLTTTDEERAAAKAESAAAPEPAAEPAESADETDEEAGDEDAATETGDETPETSSEKDEA